MKKVLMFLAISAMALPAITAAAIDTNLKYGARGTEVLELQEFLIDKGFLSGEATGNFYSLTLKAVIAYQTSAGLPTTGFVGPMTRNAINQELASDISTQAEVIETGTTTPAIAESPLDLLKKQVALLMQQIQVLQGQATTQNQILQNQQTQQVAQNQQAQQTQQQLSQIVTNTTPPPPPAPIVVAPDLHVFTGDNGVSRVGVKEDGSLIIWKEVTLGYKTGKNTSSLISPKGVSLNLSIPSLNFNKTLLTDGSNYGTTFYNVVVPSDGTYPAIISVGDSTYKYDIVMSDTAFWKNNLCTNNAAFCNQSNVAFADMTPRVEKVSEKTELAASESSLADVGSFRFLGVANSYVDYVIASTNIAADFITQSNGMGISPQSSGGGFNPRLDLLPASGAGNTQTLVHVRTSSSFPGTPGTYTITIKDIKVRGSESDAYKSMGGLPLTFSFTVK